MVKTSGLEFKAYLNDDKVWPEGQLHDGRLLNIDGSEVDDFDLDAISDTAVIKSLDGFICHEDDLYSELTVQSHFRKWQKTQKIYYALVQVDKTKFDEFKTLVKTIGCKVIN